MLRRWGLPILVGIVIAALAWQGALLAVPRGLMSLAEGRLIALRGYNQMGFGEFVTAGTRQVVRPSPDLLYSSCTFDLAQGPVLIDAEPVDAPYWSLSVFDHLTNVVFVRNNQQSGGQAVRVAIVRDGQSAPSGYQPVHIGGRRGVALMRILIDRTKPIDTLDQQRRRSSCRPA
ncbi:MAG: DUF1254 domain-containing protein [Sphingomonas sp.]|jgi:uncharacterized membrane protein